MIMDVRAADTCRNCHGRIELIEGVGWLHCPCDADCPLGCSKPSPTVQQRLADQWEAT